MKKSILSATIALVLVVCASIPCYASGIEPLWTNVSNATLAITFSNGQAVCSGTITGKTGTSGITATYTVERHDSAGYAYVGSWNANSLTRTLNTSQSYTATQGMAYRLKVDATVTSSAGVAETIYLTSADYTY